FKQGYALADLEAGAVVRVVEFLAAGIDDDRKYSRRVVRDLAFWICPALHHFPEKGVDVIVDAVRSAIVLAQVDDLPVIELAHLSGHGQRVPKTRRYQPRKNPARA